MASEHQNQIKENEKKTNFQKQMLPVGLSFVHVSNEWRRKIIPQEEEKKKIRSKQRKMFFLT